MLERAAERTRIAGDKVRPVVGKPLDAQADFDDLPLRIALRRNPPDHRVDSGILGARRLEFALDFGGRSSRGVGGTGPLGCGFNLRFRLGPSSRRFTPSFCRLMQRWQHFPQWHVLCALAEFQPRRFRCLPLPFNHPEGGCHRVASRAQATTRACHCGGCG